MIPSLDSTNSRVRELVNQSELASTGMSSEKPLRWTELIKKYPQAKRELADFMDDEVNLDPQARLKREIKCKNVILKKYQVQIDSKSQITLVSKVAEK